MFIWIKRILLAVFLMVLLAAASFFFFPEETLVFTLRHFVVHEIEFEEWDVSWTGRNVFRKVTFASPDVPFTAASEEVTVKFKEFFFSPPEVGFRADLDLRGISIIGREEYLQVPGTTFIHVIHGELFEQVFLHLELANRGVQIEDLKAVSSNMNVDVSLSYMFGEKEIETDLYFAVSPEKTVTLPKGFVDAMFHQLENGWMATEVKTRFRIR